MRTERFHRAVRPLLLCLLIVAILAAEALMGLYIYSEHQTRVCRRNIWCLGPTINNVAPVYNTASLGDVPQGEPSIMTIARLDPIISRFLACPTEGPQSISYETWPLPDLFVLKNWRGILLVWEKKANHHGKRHVYHDGVVKLVNDATFRTMMEETRRFMEEKRAKDSLPKSRPGRD